MDNRDKSYLEIKVTYIHILILLVGVILIGIFLFYLGYQAGKSSLKDQPQVAAQTGQQEVETQEIPLDTGQTKEPVSPAADRSETGQPPQEELKKQPEISPAGNAAGQEPAGQDTAGQTPKKQAEVEKQETKPLAKKAVTREVYFSIQVGAFSNFANARTYSEKFGKLGYPTEILSTVKGEKKMFRVRVGNFKTRAEAVSAKAKFEQMEKKTFAIVRSDQ